METCKGKILYYALLWAIMLCSPTIYVYCNNSVEEAKNETEVLVLQQADTDKNLLGQWKLDSLEITSKGVTQKYQLDYLLTNTRLLPRNVYISVYFVDHDFSMESSEFVFNPKAEINQKGSFTTDNGILTIIMRGEQEARVFTYNIEGDILRIQYTLSDISFNLIFKSTYKNTAL